MTRSANSDENNKSGHAAAERRLQPITTHSGLPGGLRIVVVDADTPGQRTHLCDADDAIQATVNGNIDGIGDHIADCARIADGDIPATVELIACTGDTLPNTNKAVVTDSIWGGDCAHPTKTIRFTGR